MADDNTTGLSPEHAEFLRSQAVDIELAESLGVRSLLKREDNPQDGSLWENWANHPALLFPWTNEDGRVEYQLRPDDPTPDPRGRLRKYVFRKDAAPMLWAMKVVPGSEKMLIVEGTKQALAAASYAPPGVSVYGMSGCRSWQVDGQPIPDLGAADDRDVVIILDADAAENPQVFDAGVALAKALELESARSVKFGRLSGGDTSGLDDVLAARLPARRASFLAQIIKKATAKPADARPKGKRKGADPKTAEDRVTIVCNRDRREVINDLTEAMLTKWNAIELFNHGGVISRRKNGAMNPVDRGSFHDLIQETAVTVNENDGANGVTQNFTWPDPGTMAATISRSEKFAVLDRISHAPYVREDGTVVTEPGYDTETRTMLIPDEVFDGIKVPEDPSPAEIAAARDLILTDWLGDFPFDSDTDRANVLALIVTPAIRGMVPKVPLAVIDGLQMGVGKNLLADQILTVYTGSAAEPMNWVDESDELRKQITAAFRAGSEFFVFDEAHTIEGAALAQALTASTWQDRILGVSTMANFPNRVTWMSLGNQVQVKGDLTRRVYRIALRPTYANPQDRSSTSFRHPGQSGLDLGSWTRKHRKELMTAVLTLVRAWFAQGSQMPRRGVSFGSFEIWERIVGGIIETAGMTGFLDNIKTWRSESDFDTQYWLGHLRWLRDQFGDQPFKTAEVRQRAVTDVEGYLAPPKLDDPSEKGYGKALGEAYSRLRGRRYETLWIERDGHAHGHVGVWHVHDSEDMPPAPPTVPTTRPTPDPEPVPDGPKGWLIEHTDEHVPNGITHPECTFCRTGPDTDVSMDVEPDTSQGVDKAVHNPDAGEVMTVRTDIPAVADVVTFDLETGDAGDLYRTPGDEYVRIGATAADDRPVTAYDGRRHVTVPDAVAHEIRAGKTITGHNIMAFDLPALVRAGAVTMPEIHQRAADGGTFDTLIGARYLDPPMARDRGVDAARKYDLGNLAVKYGLGEKLTDVSKPLAKKYGGWAAIPIDVNDPDKDRAADAEAFIGYMKQDVELSRKLHQRVLDGLGGSVPSYVVREHRVAALAAQISVNGFLVDQPLLTERVEQIKVRKALALGWLNEHAGVPLADGKGKPYLSPLASKAGKEAVVAALLAEGVPEKSIWRTPLAKDPQISADAMMHYGREYGQRSERLREVCKNVYRIVSARSVYETIQNTLMPDGRVHPKIGFEQATGRWSTTAPGLTVMGKRGGRHVERAVLLPDPGEVLIAADLSQVDMRALAGLSQDQGYIQMLKTDDPHTEIALALFGDASRREDAKAIGHGWNYRRGLKAISEVGGIEPRLVVQFDQSMRDRFPRLIEWQDEVQAIAESGALLDNGFGRLMRADPQRAYTQAPALMGQGAARDIMMEGMLRLPAEILPMLRAQIHDEVVFSVPSNDAVEIGRAVLDAFQFEWKGVPILADVSPAGTDWSKCYEK